VYANAVDARTAAFKPLGKLITRINNALKASDSSTLSDESFKSIIRKLQGRRASAKLTEQEKQALVGVNIHEKEPLLFTKSIPQK